MDWSLSINTLAVSYMSRYSGEGTSREVVVEQFYTMESKVMWKNMCLPQSHEFC